MPSCHPTNIAKAVNGTEAPAGIHPFPYPSNVTLRSKLINDPPHDFCEKGWYTFTPAPSPMPILVTNQCNNSLHKTGNTCCFSLTNGCIVYTAGCRTGCTTRFDNRLNEQWLFVQHGCQTDCQTGLYNRFDNRVERTVRSFNTVVKPCLSNRLYRVNGFKKDLHGNRHFPPSHNPFHPQRQNN